ncbi:MAG: flavodoxin family protein [Proteobacteria bacterium]|nr:flavodoxin family protein [Pseudomonadota bacterium]
MKILGLEGSPRQNGNTEKLVKAILAGASENGAETKFYKLAAMNISLCLGCLKCREAGNCVTQDDMQLLHDEIQASDVIVLGSPVYMWQVSGQTKLFMDRLVPFIKPDFTTRLKGKKGILMAFTQGNPDEQSFKRYFEYLENLFSFLHFDVKGTIVATGTRDTNDILQQTALLEKAREIGKNFLD